MVILKLNSPLIFAGKNVLKDLIIDKNDSHNCFSNDELKISENTQLTNVNYSKLYRNENLKQNTIRKSNCHNLSTINPILNKAHLKR
jgi:hypothetical protein